MHRRRALAAGLTRAGSPSAARGISAAVAVDAAAVGLARGELDAVTARLRASWDVDVSALRLIERLLCDPASALYRSRWPDELREQLLCVLAALDLVPASATTRIDR
ncbi:MAG TPA: hypothetical protein VLP43_12165 [Solirubrobacteraceae bacterium]|nr:hypothetical protein [Solirubrobacteraceae bacterium]